MVGDPPERAEVAFAVGRSVGPAVVRNRVRRRLRAAVRELAPVPGTYLLGVAPPPASASYAALLDDLAGALDQLGARPEPAGV